jgi:hypothetical protein
MRTRDKEGKLYKRLLLIFYHATRVFCRMLSKIMFPSCFWVQSRGECWNSMEWQHFTAVTTPDWRGASCFQTPPPLSVCSWRCEEKIYGKKKKETKRFTLLDSLSGRGRSSNLLHTAHTRPSSVRLYVRLALLARNGFYWTRSSCYWRHTASRQAIMALAVFSANFVSRSVRFGSSSLHRNEENGEYERALSTTQVHTVSSHLLLFIRTSASG